MAETWLRKLLTNTKGSIVSVSESLKVSTVRSFFSRHNTRTKLLPNISSSTSGVNEASASSQVQITEENDKNDESDNEEAYQEQLAGWFHGTCDTIYTTFTKSFQTFRACVIIISKTFLPLEKSYITFC